MRPREYPNTFDQIDGTPEMDDIPFNGGGKVKRQMIPLVAFDNIKLTTRPQYLVKGLIPRVGITVVWGPPKCGKSFWAFDLGMHVAIGMKYRGRRVQQGAVVYGAFEGSEGFKARVEAFRQCCLAEHRKPVPFYLVPMTLDLVGDHVDLISAIRDKLDNVSPALVVLDTLNRSIRGSESDDKDMTAYIRAADKIRETFGCAVLIIHHCGVDGSRPRGHTSLTGTADAQLSVRRDAAGNVVVAVEYMKDGSEGDTIVSKLELREVGINDDGDIISSCIVVPVEGAAAQVAAKQSSKPGRKSGSGRTNKAEQIALRVLREAISEVGKVPPASNHIPANTRTVTFEQWRDYAYRRGISTAGKAAQRMAFKRASERLIADNRVGAWDETAWPASGGQPK